MEILEVDYNMTTNEDLWTVCVNLITQIIKTYDKCDLLIANQRVN